MGAGHFSRVGYLFFVPQCERRFVIEDSNEVTRATRFIFIGAAALVGIPIAGCVALLIVLRLAETATWSFPPLKHVENRVELSNGGALLIDAVEQRGFRSDGWTVNAGYLAPGREQVEKGLQPQPDDLRRGSLGGRLARTDRGSMSVQRRALGGLSSLTFRMSALGFRWPITRPSPP